MPRWRFTIPAGTQIDASSNFTGDVTFTDTDELCDEIVKALARGATVYVEAPS